MDKNQFIETLTPVYSSAHLTVYLPNEDNIMLADWSGFILPTIAKEGCQVIMDILDKFPATKILNNNSSVTGHTVGAIDWVGNVWFPGIYQRGTRYFAWIYSKEFFTQIVTDQLVRSNLEINVQTFYSFDSAHQWLLES